MKTKDQGRATSAHTPEPWRGSETGLPKEAPVSIWGNPGNASFVCRVNEADARRIVACVNALAGISTERLEQLRPGELARLLEQR